MVLAFFVEETNCAYVVRLVLLGVTYGIQLIVLFKFILNPLHRSDSPVLRADVSSWDDESDSGVECDIGSAFVSF